MEIDETEAAIIRSRAFFDCGHTHLILTNPIYAGHIRHREQVYYRQDAAIIAPEPWDQVQGMLQSGAAKTRRAK